MYPFLIKKKIPFSISTNEVMNKLIGRNIQGRILDKTGPSNLIIRKTPGTLISSVSFDNEMLVEVRENKLIITSFNSFSIGVSIFLNIAFLTMLLYSKPKPDLILIPIIFVFPWILFSTLLLINYIMIIPLIREIKKRVSNTKIKTTTIQHSYGK